MRKISLTLLILMAVLLAACAPAATPAPAQPTPVPVDNQATVDASVAATLAAQPPAPTQPPPPTQPPAPTAAPTAEPAPAVAAYQPALTGVVWQWTASQAGDQVTPVTDPSRYQAQFNVDGSLNIKADCNNVTASYTGGRRQQHDHPAWRLHADGLPGGLAGGCLHAAARCHRSLRIFKRRPGAQPGGPKPDDEFPDAAGGDPAYAGGKRPFGDGDHGGQCAQRAG